jgi:hypothetical protein
MAKKIDFKRLAKEDFPSEYHNMLDTLFFPLNSFMEQVRNVLNFDEKTITTLSFTTNELSGINGQLRFTNQLSTKVRGIITLSLKNNSNSSSLVQTYPFVTFSEDSNIVTIKSISGLEANTKYDITFMYLI